MEKQKQNVLFIYIYTYRYVQRYICMCMREILSGYDYVYYYEQQQHTRVTHTDFVVARGGQKTELKDIEQLLHTRSDSLLLVTFKHHYIVRVEEFFKLTAAS